ncbi:hypothetical protein COL47_00315 [Bacillus toyonensis]|uniref:spr1630 family ClpXP-sensitive toxin n=1 Tax=Bacillus toyonensis TaxID=155322 RepID=UPI000BF6B4F0|nr:hypothetical protein [Bacillus toyonensis]PFY25757.1 hypothetical protein COL47_00315 [Bacillus toyonensis]
MKGYQFPDNTIQHIVDGILKGYKSYLAERKEKKRTMVVSSAYAWVKGNHIDHYVKEECDKLGIDYRKSKAGYTWGYLQFKNVNDKVMFILKNSSMIGDKIPTSKNKFNEETNYINKLSEMNKGVTFNKKSITKVSKNKQLTFWGTKLGIDEEELEKEVEILKQEFKRFYIISYSIDSETKMISDIQLILPDPETEMMYRIASWKDFIGTSNVRFVPEELDVIRNEKDPEEEFAGSNYEFTEVSVEKSDDDI